MTLSFTAHKTGVKDEIRLTAADDGTPVGVAILQLSPADRTAKLGSIVIGEPHRGKGLAQELLRSVEATSRGAGFRQVEAWYEAGKPYTDVVEHLLQKAGWGPHQPNMLLARGSRRMGEAPFMKVQAAPGDEIFPWAELGTDEASKLKQAHWYPDDLGPFPDEPVEPLTSLGLRVGGQVVGWMLNHRLDAETIRYTRLFVHPEHRIKARGVVLVARSVEINIASGVPHGYFGVKTTNALMRRLLERRIAPYLDSLIESRSLKLIL